MKPNVRGATSSDTEWYLELVRSLVTESDSQIPLRPDELFRTPEQQSELFGEASARGDLFLIAELNGVRVGEVNLRRGSREAFKHSAILGISVAREWRNKGIGSALMEHAIEWAKAKGALRRIELYVFATNAKAIRLYERFGFTIEGRRKGAVRVGDRFVDDLLMACLVQPPNKPPEPTTTAVTSRAPSGTARASRGRGSS
jgi:ribosomal protein S18 acetylase RimI-like enzyme